MRNVRKRKYRENVRKRKCGENVRKRKCEKCEEKSMEKM
jgi:hypothetical protein